MNVRDMTHIQIKNLILVYVVFERALYRFSGDRWQNNFCVPLTNTPNMVQNLLKKPDPLKWSWSKYTGLNLSPIWGGESKVKLGTVEFRQMEGTFDVDKIIHWCNLIAALKRYAQQTTLGNIVNTINRLSVEKNFVAFAKNVFGSLAYSLTTEESFVKDCETYIASAKIAASVTLDEERKTPAYTIVESKEKSKTKKSEIKFVSIDDITF
jgi:hypothetical protein